MSSFDATPVGPRLPPVDERLAIPGTRFEVDDGVLVHVPPADEPHGARHSKVSALVEAHAARDFDVACDMLTRTSATSDIAPDVSVYPRERDPITGGRQLEHLAFEIVSGGSLTRPGRKASQLAARGVRRVFVIDLERSRVLEWSISLATWSVLDTGAAIEDPALGAPLPIRALLHAAKADDDIARALIIKRNPVIEAHVAACREKALNEGRAEGQLESLVRALLVALEARGLAIRSDDRARILDEQDPDRLLRWIARAATCDDIAAMFSET
jgi:hypothetical protein